MPSFVPFARPWRALGALLLTSFIAACGGGGGGGSDAGGTPVPDTTAQAVADWNTTIQTAITASGQSISGNSEMNLWALTSVAVHDALNGIEARYATHVPGVALVPTAEPSAAVARAAHDVLLHYLPGAASALTTQLEATLAQSASGTTRDLGEQVGAAAAARVIAARAGAALGASTRFALTGVDQFRVAPPYGIPAGTTDVRAAATATAAYATDYRETACMGRAAGIAIAWCTVQRTADQTEIAVFWVESVTRGWNRIAATVAEQTSLPGW